jgi:glycosyltransferase involved in cell wall biosynthesis
MNQRTKIAMLGPALVAVSGVTTHLNQLFGSSLANEVTLLHFQVGSEGRKESAVQKLARFLISPFVFAGFLLRMRPHIVHINSSLEPKSYWRDIAYLLVARSLGRKVVYQVHGGALPEEFFSGNAFLTGLLRWVLSMPDAVVLLAQVELDAYQRFVPKQRLVVAANAIDAGPLVSKPIKSKTAGPLQLVYLGRLAWNKGIYEAIEALGTLVKEGRDLKLSIAGGGPEESAIKQRVAELGLSEHVRFPGPLFGEAKDALWSASDVFVFPTFHREGLPYALLEAMAAGAVPITTRVGGIPDVMQDGVHGLLIEAKDPAGLARAIGRLDDDRDALARMAEAGRQRVLAEYTVERLAQDFKRIYATLIKGN